MTCLCKRPTFLVSTGHKYYNHREIITALKPKLKRVVAFFAIFLQIVQKVNFGAGSFHDTYLFEIHARLRERIDLSPCIKIIGSRGQRQN